MKVELQVATVGSHLHGTATPESDLDQAIIYIEDTLTLVGDSLPKTRQNIGAEVDTTWFEIGKIIELVLSGNPTALEALFSTKITRVDANHPYLMQKFQDIKGQLLYTLNYARMLNAALGYATSCMTQAAKGKRVDKNLKAAVRILTNAKVSAETEGLYFGGGAGLNESWATRGALFERYLVLHEEVTALQEELYWADTEDFVDYYEDAQIIQAHLDEMRRYCV